MNRVLRTLFSATACISIFISYVPAADAEAQPQTQPLQGNAAIPAPNMNEAVTEQAYAAEALLQHVSRAQIELMLKNKEAAAQHIDEAHKIAVSLKDNKNVITRSGVRTGYVIYGTKEQNRQYLIPLIDDVKTVKTYTTGPFWSDEKGPAVSDTRIQLISIKLDANDAERRLAEAKRQLAEKNDLDNAGKELATLQKSLVTEENSIALPAQTARENLNLARFMVNHQFYDGARYALRHAKDALGDLKKQTKDEQRSERITAMETEIDDMSATIARRDPTAMQKAGEKIEKWWHEVSDWAGDKLNG